MIRVTDLKTGKQLLLLNRMEAKEKLGISEATFHKYLHVLIMCLGKKFQYIPRQTHWNDYQIHCLAFVKSLFKQGLNEAEVIAYISQFEIPETSNVQK